MKYIVSISGGKDSTACLLYMLERVPKKDIVAVFCDTKWEADETYEYLNYLEKELDIEIVRLERKKMIEVKTSFAMFGSIKKKGIKILGKDKESWGDNKFVYPEKKHTSN